MVRVSTTLEQHRPVCWSSTEPNLAALLPNEVVRAAPRSTGVMTNVVRDLKGLWQVDRKPRVPSKPTMTQESWSSCCEHSFLDESTRAMQGPIGSIVRSRHGQSQARPGRSKEVRCVRANAPV